MKQDTLDLREALADVRRAYRLILAYQRRLCDLLQTVDEALVKTGLDFQRWQPSDPDWKLPKSKKPFFRPEDWVWAFMQDYRLYCEWQDASPKKGVIRHVGIDAIADSGFNADCDGEPDPGTFEPAEKCATELRIGLWAARTKDPDWDAAWKKIELLGAWHDGEIRTVKVDGTEYRYRYLVVDIADLVDKVAVEGKLLAPLRDWLDRACTSVSSTAKSIG
jgi:hypothetical protein